MNDSLRQMFTCSINYLKKGPFHLSFIPADEMNSFKFNLIEFPRL